jgi:Protein of unknown function, DUF481
MKSPCLFPRYALFLFAVMACCQAAFAADPSPAKPAPDVLIFTNGDQLTGKLDHSTGKTVTFSSDMAGDITVSWSKVKELRSQRQFVVLSKGEHFRWYATQDVPSGSITVENDKIQLQSPQGQQVIPIKNAADVLDRETFNKEAHEVNFFRRWTGSFNLGTSIVQATQNSDGLNGGISLRRAMPTVDYLPPRNRTTVDFSGSYNRITQLQAATAPVQPDLKTDVFHADAERDQYISARGYLLAVTAFDHNFSQALDLQQIYGAGIGWTVLKNSTRTLDLKATLQYEKQEFDATASLQQNTNLFGSTFSISYVHKLPFKAVFQQQAQYLPAYNLTSAYSANETNSLTLPVHKRFSLVIGTIDSYLNNPPLETYPSPPNRQNSFQFTTGISYSLR